MPRTMTELDRERTYDELQELAQLQTEMIEHFNSVISASSTRTRKIITNLPLSLVIINRAGMIEAVNNKTLTMFGYDAEELLRKPVTLLIPDSTALKAGEATIELRALRKGGEEFPCQAQVNEVEMEDDRKLFVYLEDVTEKHRLEQLRKDFLLMVSHDIRAPLVSIIGFLDLLNEGSYGSLPDRLCLAAQRAHGTADYLVNLVNDLLDAETLDVGDFELSFEETRGGLLIEKAIKTQHECALRNNVELKSDILNDATFVADPDRIIQVLINLISNALKFSPPGSRVLVRAQTNGQQVIFSVKDDGPGIPADHLEQIFERYHRATTQKGARRGFGLGLAICKALVEKHGGEITVNSIEGQGSEFIVRLPMRHESKEK